MLIPAARGPLTRAKTTAASSAPVFNGFALNFTDQGGVASKTVTISGVAGDLWIGFVKITQDRIVNDPSGWSSPIIDISHTALAEIRMKMWWRILTGATSNPAFTLNRGSDEWGAGVLAFKGAATTPIDGAATDNDDTGNSPICPVATTTGANRLILRLFAGAATVATQDANYPASTTGIFARTILGAENAQSVGAAHHTQASAGATGIARFSNVMAVSGRIIAVTIGIKPGTPTFPFVTTDNPPVSHAGCASRPGYSPTDPRSAAFNDPMSGMEVFRIGGNNGSTIFINGTQNSGLRFPRRLVPENNPRIQAVWNADATLLMIGRRFEVGGDLGDARSFLIDVSGTHGASQPWRIIRASNSGGLGDTLPGGGGFGEDWVWDFLNPLRAYVFEPSGVYEWWPVGAPGHAVGEVKLLFGWPSGGFAYDSRGGRAQTSHTGTHYIAQFRRNSDGKWGGRRVDLTTGVFNSFIPSPHPNSGDDQIWGAQGTSADGTYASFQFPDANNRAFVNMITGAHVSTSNSDFSHADYAVVDGVQYNAGWRNGEWGLYNVLTGVKSVKANVPGGNPQHTGCRNFKDTFEHHGAAGGSTSGQRYAMWTRSGPNSGHPRGIFGIRMGATDLNQIRYICNHRSIRTTGANESHPNISPDSEYVCFNSNWHEPGVASDGDVHAYVCIIPDAWHNPNNDGS